MRLLLVAPSRLSRGDAIVAADLARRLPRSRFQVGFAAAAEAVPQLHELGMPTLPLTAATPDGNLGILDRMVSGFKPDWLIVADAFTLRQPGAWSSLTGLSVELLKERYGRPVASFDRLGWQAADYRADLYGGGQVSFPRLLDGCDLLIRTSPPHLPDPAGPGVAVTALQLGGLRDGGRRRSRAAESDGRAPADDRPVIFLVNSPWEYRNPARSLAVAQLADALPALIHSQLAGFGRPLRVVHVGPRKWRFPPASQIEYRHFSRMPYPMFHERLTAADLFVTTNVLSVTLAQAVLAGVPALVLDNPARLGQDELPGWVADAAPLLRGAYPFRVAPLGWHDLLEPLLAGNPYQDCFATAGIFDRPAVLRALAELLDDGPEQSRSRERQQDYLKRLAELPPADEALAAAVRQ